MGQLRELRVAGRAFVWVASASAVAVVAAATITDLSAANLALLAAVSLGIGAAATAVAALSARIAPSAAVEHQLMVLGGIGLAVFVANVIAAAQLMLLTVGDVGLLAALGVYAAIATIGPARLMSRAVSRRIALLDAAARRVASGDLSARVEVSGSDEIAALASSFNTMAAELGAAHDRRDALERSRRYLFAAISHDLRTPLSAIRAMVEALLDGVVAEPSDVRRYMETMNLEVRQLSLLIDDLFELATIDAGELRLQLQLLDVDGVLKEAAHAFQLQAQQAGLRLELDGATPGLAVRADARHLGRVVFNLLQNAIRHTPADGSILLSAQATGGEVRVRVADTGEGIRPDDLPHVFDQFYRGEPSRSRATGGSGLGLTIAKGIVEAHGGRIWIEPSKERGTTVIFALPEAGPIAGTMRSPATAVASTPRR